LEELTIYFMAYDFLTELEKANYSEAVFIGCKDEEKK
jgi:hypothetical protein